MGISRKELAKMIPPGVAKFSDRAAMERLVYLFSLQRKRIITCGEGAQLLNLFGRFGMTPSDRGKVSADAPKESKLAAFLKTRPKTAAPGPKTDAQPTQPVFDLVTTFPQIAN